MQRFLMMGRALVAVAALGAVALPACNKSWDAGQARSNLEKLGYTVSASTPDGSASGIAGVTGGECFDVKKGADGARVCIWTCTTAEACISVPAQKVTLRGSIANHLAFVDAKDEAVGNGILRSLNP